MSGYVDKVGHLQVVDHGLLCCLLLQKGFGLKDMGHLGRFIFCVRQLTQADLLLLVNELGDSMVAHHQKTLLRGKRDDRSWLAGDDTHGQYRGVGADSVAITEELPRGLVLKDRPRKKMQCLVSNDHQLVELWCCGLNHFCKLAGKLVKEYSERVVSWLKVHRLKQVGILHIQEIHQVPGHILLKRDIVTGGSCFLAS